MIPFAVAAASSVGSGVLSKIGGAVVESLGSTAASEEKEKARRMERQLAALLVKFENFGYAGEESLKKLEERARSVEAALKDNPKEAFAGFEFLVEVAKGEYELLVLRTPKDVAYIEVQVFLRLQHDQNVLSEAGVPNSMIVSLRHEFADLDEWHSDQRTVYPTWKQLADCFQHYYLRENAEGLRRRLIREVYKLFHYSELTSACFRLCGERQIAMDEHHCPSDILGKSKASCFFNATDTSRRRRSDETVCKG